MSPRRRVAVGVLGSLAALNGVHAGWAWLDNTRLFNQITRSFISPKLAEALQSIKGVVAAFEKDVRPDVKWDSALVNLLVLNTIHERATALQAPPKAGLKANLLSGDEAVGREAARYVRFASAAYGMLMLKGANVMSWDSGWPPVHKFSLQELTTWCITKHCGIQDADLVRMNLFEERELHLPAYLLTVDHATKSVVLSVRGTFSMQDTVTDLVCDSADFMGGSCHRGLCQGAKMLLAHAKGDVLQQLAEHEGYRLVVTGHSLGGGVSILLTMMLLKHRRELRLAKTEVLCYAFAPPPVFGPLHKLSGETRRAIRAFVFGNDMVCRLSLASASGLFRDLKEVDAIGATLPVRLKYLVNEHRPHLSVHDDGLGTVGMRVAYRYATILQRTRSRGGNSKGGSNGQAAGGGATIDHPVEAFVQKKLAEDFTKTGTANVGFRPRTASASASASEDAWRTGHDNSLFKSGGVLDHGWGGGADDFRGDPYARLLIPGSIYHMKKLGAESVAASAVGALAETPLDARRKLYWMERERPEEFAKLLMVDTAIVDHLPLAYEDALHALYGEGLGEQIAQGAK
ncbi:unnamed protein product [Pylaiella littoralis]